MTSLASTRRLALLLALVALAGCYGKNDIVAPDVVFSVSATPTAIPANGFATSRIVARVDARSDRELLITFTASRGGIGTTAMSPDSNGEVVTFLRSDTVPGTVVVTANVKRGDTVEASRSVAVEFEQASSASVARLTVSPTQLPADGASQAEVVVEVNPMLSPRTVTLETTNGSFTANATNTNGRRLPDIATGSDGVARAVLYAPKEVGAALVTATTASGFSASQTVIFETALPDVVFVESDKSVVARMGADAAELTVTLLRDRGQVTNNTVVTYSARDSAGNDLSASSFSKVVLATVDNTDSSPFKRLRATATFNPDDTAALGPVTITVTAGSRTGTITLTLN